MNLFKFTKLILCCFFLLSLGMFSSCTDQALPKNATELQTAIQDILEPLDGDFALAYKSFSSPDMVLINPDERFHAASTMKTPVLIELYKQAEQGHFSMQDSIPVITTFKSIVDGSLYTMDIGEDSESDLYHKIGKNESIYDLTYKMITESSNLATNILIEMVDATKVTATMRELGADSIEVLRGVEDLKAYEAGLSNSTTARDLMMIFTALASDTLISPEANRSMIDILKDQKFNEMFPAQLPPETPVAHKTGWITGVHHDSGIIYLPEGNAFVLVFLSKNAPDRDAVLQASSTIARLIYDFEVSR